MKKQKRIAVALRLPKSQALYLRDLATRIGVSPEILIQVLVGLGIERLRNEGKVPK